VKICGETIVAYSENYTELEYNRTPLLWKNWGGELSGYAESPDNWIFYFN